MTDKTQEPSAIAPAPGMTSPVKKGRLAVVVGAGSTGRSAARLLHALGARVRLLDSAEISPEVVNMAEELGFEAISGPHVPEQFLNAALVVASPGIPLEGLHWLLARSGNPPLIAEMELALRFVHEPVLAVTGTSGKTTTVSLAAAMLKEEGKKVFLGGNIGTPLSEYVLSASGHTGPGLEKRGEGERADALALEMSSFQLQGTHSLHARAAVLLNLSANHLDHHKDMAEYSEAKFRIFNHQTAEDLAVLPEELLADYRARGFGGRVEIFRDKGRFTNMALLGAHNAANAEAAWLACREFGVSEEAALRAARNFTPLRHRLEKAGTVDGVLYVNDSKSTTVDALRVALDTFTAPVILMAGGKFKGGDLASLRGIIAKKVKAVTLYGGSREVFEQAIAGSAPLHWDETLPKALLRARSLAGPGDVVLLSPATSSYDQYHNYIERGDHFCAQVRALAETAKEGAV